MAVWAALSATCTVHVVVPVPLGVPFRSPPVDNDIPVGGVPTEFVHVYGKVPPVAANWKPGE